VAYVLRDDEVRDDEQPTGARPRRRTRNQGRRGRTVRFALTDQEYAELSDAARQAGLARGAFAAEAALSVARGVVVRRRTRRCGTRCTPWTAPRCWCGGSA
jgi:hypothetical protein